MTCMEPSTPNTKGKGCAFDEIALQEPIVEMGLWAVSSKLLQSFFTNSLFKTSRCPNRLARSAGNRSPAL